MGRRTSNLVRAFRAERAASSAPAPATTPRRARRAATPKAPAARETAIVGAILEFLRYSDVLAWRQNTGGRRSRSGKYVQFSVPGTPDVLGVVRRGPHLGRFVGIEVKVPGKDLEPDQVAWAEMMRPAGVICLCVHSVEECQRLLTAELAKPALAQGDA